MPHPWILSQSCQKFGSLVHLKQTTALAFQESVGSQNKSSLMM